jgi:hypothetical protein
MLYGRKVFTTQQVRTTTCMCSVNCRRVKKTTSGDRKNICDRSSISVQNQRRQAGNSTRHCIRKLIVSNCVWASHVRKWKLKIESETSSFLVEIAQKCFSNTAISGIKFGNSVRSVSPGASPKTKAYRVTR